MAKVGLHDGDSQARYPNLALMKVSAWHKSRGDTVFWTTPLTMNGFDLIYSSKVFTFTPEDTYLPEDGRVLRGGTGYMNRDDVDVACSLPEVMEHLVPDYSLYSVENAAYGFVTRGCIRTCPWCIVPKKEGNIRPHADIEEFWCGQERIVLMDNNILAHEHGLAQLEKIAGLGKSVRLDCNQGLDARLVDKEVAELLARVNWHILRFACDKKSQMPSVANAVNLVRKAAGRKSFGGNRIFIYTLVKDIDDALERVMFLKGMDLDPFAQPYRDFENGGEPEPLQKDFARWVNRKAIFRKCTWAEYRKHGGQP